MERNDNLNDHNPVSTGTGGPAYGAAGTTGSSVTPQEFGGTTGTAGTSGAASGQESGTQGMKDQARHAADQAKQKAQQAASTAREKVGEFKTTLADKLEQGAERLRQRSTSTGTTESYAGATGAGTASMSSGQNERMAQMGGRLASGMESTAHWLRETDMDTLKSDVESQVRNHPGRTLLVAVGLGYLIGKAFRR